MPRLVDRLPWRLTHRGGFWNTSVFAPSRKLALGPFGYALGRWAPPSVTAVIAVRNRPPRHLRCTVASLRAQRFDQRLLTITIVDSGSDPDCAAAIARVASEFDVHLLRIPNPGPWNKPKCLNIGIRNARSTFLLSSDSDIYYAPDYLSTAIDHLRRHPLSVVYSRMMDLTPDATERLQQVAAVTPALFDELLGAASPRSCGTSNEGISMTFTAFYALLRGYDEVFEGWGSEDTDLQRRFERLGLQIASISDRSVYLHQWHPKGLGIEHFDETAARNASYLRSARSLVRNVRGWGVTPTISVPTRIHDAQQPLAY